MNLIYRLSLIVLVSLCCSHVQWLRAQEVYFVSGVAVPADTGWIGKINLEDCSFEIIYQNLEQWGWRDIAICPNGKMYGCGLGIDEIDLVNQSFTRLHPLPLGYDQDGLVCSCDNILYGAGQRRDFFSYNVNTGEFRDLGKLPVGVYPAGDLYFFEGKLYASGINLPLANIIEINIEHPEQSAVIYVPTKRVIYGFYLVQKPCEEPFFYTQWKNAPPSGDELLERSVGIMNPYTFEESKHCSYYFRPDNAYGWAYPGEGNCTDSPPCEIQLDLDENDSEGLSPVDFQDTAYCNPEWIFMTDDDVSVYSGKTWDSAIIKITTPNLSLATLNGVTLPGFQITGLGTNRLMIENIGNKEPLDLATQLTQLGLVPDPAASDITYEVAFVAYASDLVSDTAFSFLSVVSPEIISGRDTTLQFCREDKLLDLHDYLPSDAHPGGEWAGNIPMDGIISLSDLDDGVLTYITQDAHCGPDTAEWTIQVFEKPEVNLGADTSICAGAMLSLTLPPGTAGIWQDGSISDRFEITAAGWFSATLTDTIGCSTTDSVYVELLEEIWLDSTLYLCKDENLIFKNTLVNKAGIYNIHVGGSGQCDTIWTLAVYDEDDFRGIVQEGNLCFDPQVILHVRNTQAAAYEWSTGAKSFEIQTSSEGWFSVTITYGNHCEWIDSVLVTDCQDPAYFIPNVFSPNGDGVNDDFFVSGKDIASVSMEIYDRWGELLYISDVSISPVWNGKFKNKVVPPGVYAYKINVTLLDGRVFHPYGTITLIR